jgi:hypothetical protein
MQISDLALAASKMAASPVLRIHLAVLTILVSITGAAQAQSSRWDELVSLPFPGAYPTDEIEGTLTSVDVPDVRATCESANPPLRLDLSGLRSADSDGIRALRSLSEAGAELHGANPYINQLLLEANK